MSKKVVIQGQAASFHHIAAQKIEGNDISMVFCDTFADVFNFLDLNKGERAVVAIENSLFGSINEVYDLLLKYKFWISGELYLKIDQCLMTVRGSTIESIKEVYSHPVALAQCEHYLDKHLPGVKRFEHHDTSGAAKDIATWQDTSRAAIASEAAASLHGLEILDRHIQSHRENYTRFVLLTASKTTVNEANKTSLVLKTADKPGALYHALGCFARRDINLIKLQSRPIAGEAWRYIFYVDVDRGINEQPLIDAFSEIGSQECGVVILGSYKTASKPI